MFSLFERNLLDNSLCLQVKGSNGGNVMPQDYQNRKRLQQFQKILVKEEKMKISDIVQRFFIAEDSLEPQLQLLSQIIEDIVYVAIINGIRFSQLLGFFSQSPFIFVSLVLLCLIKLSLRILLRFGLTLIALQLIILNNDSWLVPNCLLLAMLTISQLISSIIFDFGSKSVHVESRIQNKVVRIIILMGNIIALTLIKSPTYIHLVSAILFLGLLWSKERSLMKNEEFRNNAIRFCLWAASEHLRLFISTFLPFANTIPAIIISFLISLSFFTILLRFRPNPNCHELIAKEQFLHLSFTLLRYSSSSVYDRKLEEFISGLLGQSLDVEVSALRVSQPQPSTFYHSPKVLALAVLNLLKKSDGFLQSLLCAEIHTEGGRVLVAKEELQKARNKMGRFDWLRKVLLLHSQQRLKDSFFHSSQKIFFRYEQSWKAFLDFQQLLHKATSQHLQLNLYLKNTDIELDKIKEICLKIAEVDAEVTKKFKCIQMGFIASTELFVGFLVRVRGDYSGAEAVISQQQLRERYLLDGCIQEKMFIRLLLSNDGLTIMKVGFNSYQLLGHNRSELEGQRVQRLVPPFFRPQHQKISNDFVHSSFQSSLLFNKKTVVLNGRGTYNAGTVALRLGQREEGLCFEGFIQVSENKQHDFDCFFVGSTNGEILESSEGLFEEELAEKTVIKLELMFQGVMGGPLIRTTNQKLYEVYEPLMYFKGQDSSYFYAKRLIRKDDVQKEGTNGSTLKELTAPILQGKVQSVFDSGKNQAEEIADLESQIRNKEIHILSFVFIFFILCLFVSEYLMTLSANTKYSNQNFAVTNFAYVLQYYDVSFRLVTNIQYIEFGQNYNYTNTFIKPSLPVDSLKLQTINQKLKQFNRVKYKISTYNSAISYQQTNYEIVLMIVSDANIYQKFATDAFMKSAALDQSKIVNIVYALSSTTDYRIALLALMNTFVQIDLYYENLALWVGFGNMLLFIFLAIRIYWKLKQVEDVVLQWRCDSTSYIKKIRDILLFMKEITLEEVPVDKMSEEMHIYEATNKAQNNNTLLSEASLIRDNSARNMSIEGVIPLETLNKTGFIEDMQKVEGNEKPERQSRYTFRKTTSYRYVLIGFALFVLILIGLHASNQIWNYNYRNVDEVTSLNSVLLLFRSMASYSLRAVMNTFGSILQRNLKRMDPSTTYNSVMTSFANYLTTYTLPVFPEVQFSEFSNFSSSINRLYQETVCNYMPCLPQYSDQLNLNYINVMRKYTANLSSLYKTTFNYTQSQMATYIANNKRYIDLVFYTEALLRAYIAGLTTTYINGYINFMNNQYVSKINHITAMIVTTVLGLFTFLFFLWRLKRQQDFLVMITNFYRDSQKQ